MRNSRTIPVRPAWVFFRASLFIYFLALLFLCIVLVKFAQAAIGVTIEPGTRVALGTGTEMSLNCNDVIVQGTLQTGPGVIADIGDVTISGQLNGGTGLLTVGGNWTNNGRFDPGQGEVWLDGVCQQNQIVEVIGTNAFNSLQLGSGVTYVFPSGNSTTILTSLDLGTNNQLESSGSETAFITPAPGATVTGDPSLFKVEIIPATHIPTLGVAAQILLFLLLVALAARRRHRLTTSAFRWRRS